MLRHVLLSVLVSVLVASCATSPTGRRQLMLVSESQAISASRQAYVQEMGKYQQAGKLVTDPRVLDRVEVITERLVAQAVRMRPDSAQWEWSVQVGNGKAPPPFLSTHPSDAQRQQRLGALASKMMPAYQAPGTRPSHPVRIGSV